MGVIAISVSIYPSLRKTAEVMVRSGWGGYYGYGENSSYFLLACLNNAPCAERLFTFGKVNLDLLYYGLLGWTFLGALLFLRLKPVSISLRYGQHFAERKEIEPLVERRTPEKMVDSAIPSAPSGKSPPLVGYLGVWLGNSMEEVVKRRKEDEIRKEFDPKKDLFLRLPPRIERIHTITYAGTGGGKTVGIFRPRIALDAAEGNIAIIFDTKYPNPNDSYVDVRDWFRAFGRKVSIIDPFGMEREEEAIQLPVLEGIKDYPSALDAARLIYPPDIENGDEGRVYIANARTLLAGILYALSASDGYSLSFREAARIANMEIGSLQEFFRQHPHAKTAIQSALGADRYILSGSLNRLVGDLEIFQLESADWLFQRGEKAVEVVRLLQEPGMIHLVFPERYIRGSAGRAILRFFKRYFDRAILELVERIGGPLPYHVNYYYDELALFGYLPDLDNDLATLRSRNISVHMATQSRAQVQDIYGSKKWEATENNNIGTFYLVPGSYTYEEAYYWSQLLGRYSTLGIRYGESKTKGGTAENISLGEQERELVTVDELLTMGVGEMITLVRGFHPILIKTYPVESPLSPLHWIYKEGKAYREVKLRERALMVFGETLRENGRTYQLPPEGLRDIYRSFEEILLDLGAKGSKLVEVQTGKAPIYLLPRNLLEEMNVHPETIKGLVHYFFLQHTPRGLAISSRCPYGNYGFSKLLDKAKLIVEKE